MKNFKPQSEVKEAITYSTKIEFTDNTRKIIQRKMPLPYYPHKEDYDSDSNEDDCGRDLEQKGVTEREKNMKNWAISRDVSRPNGATGKLVKVTGFEETYIEPPISPEEDIEDKILYDP
jgi:hypothetical protein